MPEIGLSKSYFCNHYWIEDTISQTKGFEFIPVTIRRTRRTAIERGSSRGQFNVAIDAAGVVRGGQGEQDGQPEAQEQQQHY